MFFAIKCGRYGGNCLVWLVFFLYAHTSSAICAKPRKKRWRFPATIFKISFTPQQKFRNERTNFETNAYVIISWEHLCCGNNEKRHIPYHDRIKTGFALTRCWCTKGALVGMDVREGFRCDAFVMNHTPAETGKLYMQGASARGLSHSENPLAGISKKGEPLREMEWWETLAFNGKWSSLFCIVLGENCGGLAIFARLWFWRSFDLIAAAKVQKAHMRPKQWCAWFDALRKSQPFHGLWLLL